MINICKYLYLRYDIPVGGRIGQFLYDGFIGPEEPESSLKIYWEPLLYAHYNDWQNGFKTFCVLLTSRLSQIFATLLKFLRLLNLQGTDRILLDTESIKLLDIALLTRKYNNFSLPAENFASRSFIRKIHKHLDFAHITHCTVSGTAHDVGAFYWLGGVLSEQVCQISRYDIAVVHTDFNELVLVDTLARRLTSLSQCFVWLTTYIESLCLLTHSISSYNTIRAEILVR